MKYYNDNLNKLNLINKIFFKFFIIILLYLCIKKAKFRGILLFDFPNIKKINIENFFKLKDKPKDINNQLILKEKQKFLNFLSKCSGYKINSIDTIFLTQNYKFGNILIILNKVIFYCEIIKCKRIILNNKYIWFIKKKIHYTKYNITIEVGEKKYFNNNSTIFDISDNFLYYFSYIKPEFRLNLIKNEILNNLPKVEINPNHLFIYIRSGDIFKIYNPYYSQPPLCFYKRIINNNKFGKISIISQNNLNPVINKLIKEYPYIIFNKNPLDIDIAYLINSYNIVGGISTFINILIRLNDKLRFFWEYNIDSIEAKIIHFHHSFYKPFKNITYFRMEPSNEYKSKMANWSHTESQINLMIKEKCYNNFTIIKA